MFLNIFVNLFESSLNHFYSIQKNLGVYKLDFPTDFDFMNVKVFFTSPILCQMSIWGEPAKAVFFFKPPAFFTSKTILHF